MDETPAPVSVIIHGNAPDSVPRQVHLCSAHRTRPPLLALPLFKSPSGSIEAGVKGFRRGFSFHIAGVFNLAWPK